MPRGGADPGRAAAETEADAEYRSHAHAAQVLDGSARVRLHAVIRRLVDVRHVLEIVVPLLGAGSAAEVIEGDRGVTTLGKPQRELLVEPVEAAHPAAFDLFDNIVAAGHIGTGLFGLADLVALSDDDDLFGRTAEAVRQNDGSANKLVSLSRVDAQPHRQLDRLVKLCESDLFQL